jgi:hypothetical protein
MNVLPDQLNNPAVADYFTRNPHRLAACRALLDLLSIPLPSWAVRDISGRAAATRNIMRAFRADNPETLYQATVRKSRECASRLPNRIPHDVDPLTLSDAELELLRR